jgi:hypothetical protein
MCLRAHWELVAEQGLEPGSPGSLWTKANFVYLFPSPSRAHRKKESCPLRVPQEPSFCTSFSDFRKPISQMDKSQSPNPFSTKGL